MTALVINETQSEGGGGHFLAKCNTARHRMRMLSDKRRNRMKRRIFSLFVVPLL